MSELKYGALKTLDPLSQQALGERVRGAIEYFAPVAMKALYPRVYENVGAYYSPKSIAVALLQQIAEVVTIGVDKSSNAGRVLIPAIDPMIKRKMPYLFIGPELLSAVKATAFKDEIDWVNLPLPYAEGVFVFPRGAFKHPQDGECAFAIWSRKVPGVYGMPFSKNSLELPHTSFSILAYCPEASVWYETTLRADVRPTVLLQNLFYRNERTGEDYPQYKEMGMLDEPLNLTRDSGFIEQLGCIVFGTILAINARPGLVTKEALIRRVKTKKESTLEFWSPNVVGKDYVQKRGAGTGEGTYASPRMHWRRGHFRNQACGVGRSERKTIWLEPVLVAAGDERTLKGGAV